MREMKIKGIIIEKDRITYIGTFNKKETDT